MDKIKSLVLVLFLIAIYYGLVVVGTLLLNMWLKAFSIFGITFMGIDLRAWFVGFILSVFGVWLILELDDYLQFKEWRRKWK